MPFPILNLGRRATMGVSYKRSSALCRHMSHKGTLRLNIPMYNDEKRTKSTRKLGRSDALPGLEVFLIYQLSAQKVRDRAGSIIIDCNYRTLSRETVSSLGRS